MTVVHGDNCIASLATAMNNLASKIDHLSVEVQRLHHRFDKVEEEMKKDDASNVWQDDASTVWQDIRDPRQQCAAAQAADLEEAGKASSSAAAVVIQPAQDDDVPTPNAVAASNDGDGSSSSATPPAHNAVPLALADALSPEQSPIAAPAPRPSYPIPPHDATWEWSKYCSGCGFSWKWGDTLPLNANRYEMLMNRVFKDYI